MSTSEVSPDITEESTRSAGARRGRKGIVLLSLAVVAVVVAGAITWVGLQPADGATDSAPKVKTSTAQIERGTLTGTSTAQGTLDYADQRPVAAGLGGIVTSVPGVGGTIGLGQELYRVDNTPVPMLHGPLPMWRAFTEGMSDGPDVLQLEMSLAALGYFDREPDGEFAASTARAIKAWQKALGLEQTGTLDLGSVVFMPSDVRVSAVTASVGTPVGPGAEVLKVTSLTQQIDVELKLSEQRLAAVGGAVQVQLPGGGDPVAGTIVEVGVPTEKETNGEKKAIIPVRITLDDPAAAGTLQRASVMVAFPTEQREDVLSVPVEALVALDASTFGVELVQKDGTTKRVPVTTGLFAAGKVEISGDGITEGQEVVVPAE